MFKSTIALLALALFSHSTTAQNNSTTTNIGYTGTLSSLDGGLGGTVRVVDATTLQITSYTLKDASAPALYWWGSTDGVLKDGFRISNEQVKSAATSNVLEIKLDAGKTAADFSTVGLWCERLFANFGQATLKATDGTTAASTSSSASATSSKSAATPTSRSYGTAFGVMVAATVFMLRMA